MEAVILIGLQASGKSTFYRERFFRTHVRISLDMLRTRHREHVLLVACLAARQPFVVDNTNPTVAERARYVRAARRVGFRVVGYYLRCDHEDCLRRNEARPAEERVPAKGIRGTARRFQPPTLAEGFDALYYVNSVEGGFVVEECREGQGI